VRVLHLIPRRVRALLLTTTAGLVAASVAIAAPAAASGAAPVANDDGIVVAEGGTATTLAGVPLASVLANDTDPEDDPLVAVLTSLPDHGTLTLNPDGTFRYDHDGGEVRTDSFAYRASDGTSLSPAAVVTVTVTPVNDAPVALDDAYTVPEHTVLTVTAANRITLNDTDAESDALTVLLVTSPDSGNLTLNANGTFTYTPLAEYAGPVTFTYQSSDGFALSNVATVTITVTPVNDAPVAVADSIRVNEGGTATTLTNGATSVLANDTDPENGVLTAQRVSNPARGVLSLQSDGTFTYTHDGGETTTDSFTYRVSDGDSSSNTVTVTITIDPVNDAPVAVADSIEVGENGSATALVGGATSVLANDTDAENAPLSAVVTRNPAHGSLTLNANGTFRYTPTADYSGSDSFAYRASDGNAQSAPAEVSITVTPGNAAPVATADALSVAEGGTATTLTGGATSLLANDIDADGDTLTAQLVGDVTRGTLTLNANGTFTYVHDGSETTSDSFTYRVSDGDRSSNPVTVTITVTPVNDAPVAVGDSMTVAEGGTAATLSGAVTSVLDNDTDAEEQSLTAVLVTGPSRGTLTLNPDGTFRYTHDGGETTTDSFTYRASDGNRSSNTVTVTITVTPVDDAPVAVPDAYTVAEDATLTVAAPGVRGNDTDAEGAVLTTALVSDVAHGRLVLNSDGSFAYTPDAGYSGPDAFTYRVSDGSLSSVPATVALTVTAVNDAPVAVADAMSVAEGGTATTLVGGATSVLANDTDADDDPLTAAVVAGPAHGTLTLDEDGTFSYVHDGSETTSDSFTYRASDGTTTSATTTVALTITPVNDAPVAAADAYTTTAGTTLTVTAAARVTLNDTDAEGDALTAVLVTEPAHGALTLRPDGTFTYTPATGYAGSDSFTYRAHDGSAGSTPVTVTLAVTARNDAPSISGLSDQVVQDGGRLGSIAFTVDDDVTPAADLRVRAVSDDTRLVPRSALTVSGTGAERRLGLELPAGRWGTAEITVTVADATGARTSASFTLTVLRGRPCTIQGTPGDDVLVGTPGRDVICAGAGDDIIRGLGGNDVLRGGAGDDRILGGAGHDVLAGRGGHDVLMGGAGYDRLLGGPGRDRLVGGPGRDRIAGGPGSDSVGRR
jgi:large repetitive protein